MVHDSDALMNHIMYITVYTVVLPASVLLCTVLLLNSYADNIHNIQYLNTGIEYIQYDFIRYRTVVYRISYSEITRSLG